MKKDLNKLILRVAIIICVTAICITALIVVKPNGDDLIGIVDIVAIVVALLIILEGDLF